MKNYFKFKPMTLSSVPASETDDFVIGSGTGGTVSGFNFLWPTSLWSVWSSETDYIVIGLDTFQILYKNCIDC